MPTAQICGKSPLSSPPTLLRAFRRGRPTANVWLTFRRGMTRQPLARAPPDESLQQFVRRPAGYQRRSASWTGGESAAIPGDAPGRRAASRASRCHRLLGRAPVTSGGVPSEPCRDTAVFTQRCIAPPRCASGESLNRGVKPTAGGLTSAFSRVPGASGLLGLISRAHRLQQEVGVAVAGTQLLVNVVRLNLGCFSVG